MGDGSETKRVSLEVEEYDCGCRVRFGQLDYGEAADELRRKSVLVQTTPPAQSRKRRKIFLPGMPGS